jgi:hypothetical protein
MGINTNFLGKPKMHYKDCWREHHDCAINEIIRLREAIRNHRDQVGDDRCYRDDYDLYQVLGEPIPEHACQQDPPEVMLENCKRYVASRHDPSKPYLSIIEELSKDNKILKKLLTKQIGFIDT